MTEPLTTSSPNANTDWLLIGVLLALVLPLRVWLICNTEVTARDSIGYIRYALQFEQKPWAQVLKDNHQHPGYPVLVWLTSLPVRTMDGETTPENMELSAQLVNLVASLVLILPMYFLGRQFFERTVCFWATLLYQYLPVSAQHLSDGISEPFFLVLLVSGLLQAVRAVREQATWRGALCGLFTGAAYLTRPEGALILPAFALTLIVMQLRSEWRSSWRTFFASGLATMLAAMLIGSIYVVATGRITNKLSAIEIINNMLKLVADQTQNAGQAGLHLFANSFTKTDNKFLMFERGLWALFSEVMQGLHYAGIVPAALGFAWAFFALRRNPGFWLVMIFGLLQGLILIALAMSVGYVSDRHVMILVMGGCFFLVHGLRELPRRVLARWNTSESAVIAWKTWHRSAAAWFAILVLALIGSCLPKATQRLHGNRVANHQAGIWLNRHVAEGDVVEDDHAWSVFFSGLIFQEGREQALPPEHKAKCYIVTTQSRDPMIDVQRRPAILAAQAQVVYVWPESAEPTKAKLVVYAQPREYRYHPWRQAP